MLGYLSKFVLQMLPTISATVIGAYIVGTWINPKTPPEPAKTASRAQPQQAAQTSPAPKAPAQEAAAAPVEAKATVAAEGTPAKAADGPDNIRIIPIVKQQAAAEVSGRVPASVPVPETATSETPAANGDSKDANELARAAIQRLRGGTEEAPRAEEPGRMQEAGVTPEPGQPALAAPPLPPAVSIAAPRYPEDESADQASLPEPDRLTPPAEIPAERNPLGLQASHRVEGNLPLADDLVYATKSFFRAITPR
jgi:hypothetical protein